jgi:RHS repeat-associated protein
MVEQKNSLPTSPTEQLTRTTFAFHDQLRQIESITHNSTAAGTFFSQTYTWDAVGNKTQRSIAGGISVDYQYDLLDRLKQSTHSVNGTTNYNWDDVNNRTDTGFSIGGSTDDSYKLNEYISTPFNTRTYDLNGNTTSINTAIIEYDYRNQMTNYSDGSSTTDYKYDALGRRIAKITDGNEIQYLHYGSRVIEEQDNTGTTLATYVYGNYIDEVLNMQRAGNNYYYYTDDMFNVMSLTNSSGSVVETYDYDDFGNPTNTSSIGNPYLFNGRRYDQESGFYYYRTRYQDPTIGRFTTRDTIGIWGDASNLGNGYTYVGNNPWSYVDPWGLEDTGPDENSNSNGWFSYSCECIASGWNDFLSWRPFKCKETVSKEANDFLSSLAGPISLEGRAIRSGMPGSMYKANPYISDSNEINIASDLIGDRFERYINDQAKGIGISASLVGCMKYVRFLKASELELIKKGTVEWNQAVKEVASLGKGKNRIRVETASDAIDFLREARGNMNRYRPYTRDSGIKYDKGYETHNHINEQEFNVGNDLQHLKWFDGISSGHIYYDLPN